MGFGFSIQWKGLGYGKGLGECTMSLKVLTKIEIQGEIMARLALGSLSVVQM